MTPNGETKLFGIIGNPVKHSFSPAMHTQAFEALGINACYLPFLAQSGHLREMLSAFEQIGLQGFNVTVPFKEEIIPLLTEVDPVARELGSVNTVVRTPQGWYGTSTDGQGFVRSLQEEGWPLAGIHVAMLGAGGSAKAIAHALAQAGIASLSILNRSQDKAQELAHKLAQRYPNLELTTQESRPSYDLLINTTSLGMQPGDCPAAPALIQKAQRVADIIYNPRETKLLAQAKSLCLPSMNGIGMLLYQGVLAFELWTKGPAPITVMQGSLLNSLGR